MNSAVIPKAEPTKWMPTKIPIADDDHIDAAVVKPRILAPLFMMIPAPRKPIPVRRLPTTLVVLIPTASSWPPNHSGARPVAEVSAQHASSV